MSTFASRRTMMVDTQVRPSDVTKYPIIDALLSVPRELYVPDGMRELAYVDGNVPLAPSRVVLAPRTQAKLLDALNIEQTELVLDVGAGLGYSAALIARLAEAVVALEEDAAMAAEAEATLASEAVDNAAVITGPLVAGAPKHGPYDVIVIEGGVEQVPDSLVEQLKEGGRMGAVFMEGHLGIGRIGYKIDGRMNWRFGFNADAPVLPGFAASKAFAL
ncbi:protein-L-isoaspartate O-methyltransferase [Tropicimonas sp. IMCC34043]|uniref:protein-L-isoaspartate O-methyltransferase family protein n=1 Tax=Tropicimonas sp. IMCC34043 TaxID=2248760 RepID=UPI000E26DCA3|nr:protein-L-isoaspartate O-methyltransferase [Tropicimonas sp. IMCC34043]